MPFTVKDILEGRPKPITIHKNDFLQKALDIMLENDFSQLPVVDHNYIAEGIITKTSILRWFNYDHEINIGKFQVLHLHEKGFSCRLDSDLFEVLDNLKDVEAALVVNDGGSLLDIITNYDAVEFVRNQAEDMMFVEDIEGMLREIIRSAFTDENNVFDQKGLEKILINIMDGELRGRFTRALQQYIKILPNVYSKLDRSRASDVFLTYFLENRKPQSLESLTLSELIQIVSNKEKNAYFESIFQMDPRIIGKLLQPIRETRNKLAHFRGEITQREREQLRSCAQLLEKFQTNIPMTASKHSAEIVQENSILAHPHIEKELKGSGKQPRTTHKSRYTPLAHWLEDQPEPINEISVSFQEIEKIIGVPLPSSARKHHSYWANNLERNPQARQWYDAGWEVVMTKINTEIVVFRRRLSNSPEETLNEK